MLKILWAEIQYHRILFVIYMTMAIAVTFVERALEDGGRFYIAMFTFLLIQNWITLKGKEKRDQLLAVLPRPIVCLALFRLGMILVGAILLIIVYKSMHVFLNIQGHANYPVTVWRIVHYVSVVVFMFSVYFIFSDLIGPKMRESDKYEVLKERFIQILMALALILNVVGIYAMLKRPVFLYKIFEVLFSKNPFDHTVNIQRFVVVTLVVAGVSLISYSFRKNYIYR